MNEEMLLKQMKFIRYRTIAALDATSEAIADDIPNGFNNNLRWNFGHIIVSQENIITYFLGKKGSLPDSYRELFNRGTSPKDWNQEIPTLEQLRVALEKQYERMVALCSGKIADEGENPLVLSSEYEFKTLGEAIGFTNFHESVHQGNINSLKLALGVKDLWAVQ
ncbi:DinB family protein [Paucisalibacillus sp. EB02]|uniref:DinB family protein n=1 Tax=Paucisalibacillus sp. EB02 TaxID=1347087 RepID=UPI0004B632A4|nr:DinB family protein [Paucisalibacillus sp. EB02]